MRRAPHEVTAIMQRLMAGPDGMTGKALQIELGDLTSGASAGRISRLVQLGGAFCVRQGAAQTRHFFATQALADAWKATQPGRGNPNLNAVRHVPKAKANINYGNTEAPAKSRLVGEVKGMDTVVVERIKTPDPRFHVPADHRGPFSLAGVGRDVQTGRAWA